MKKYAITANFDNGVVYLHENVNQPDMLMILIVPLNDDIKDSWKIKTFKHIGKAARECVMRNRIHSKYKFRLKIIENEDE